MTKEQREAYRPVLEAWLDGELEFSEDGKNWSRWDSKWPPVCNWPPDHYRRKPKPKVGYGILLNSQAMFGTLDEARRECPEDAIVFRCEEVLE